MKRVFAIAVASTLAVVVAGCGSSGKSDATSPSILKMAVIDPITGPAAVYGTTTVAVTKHFVDDLNTSGGVKIDGKTYKVELKVFDDQANPQKAQAVAREVIDDGYKFILGPFGSGSASSVQSLMAQTKDDVYWQLFVASVVGPTKNPNVFRTGSMASTYTQSTIDWLKNHPEIQRVGLITDQANTALLAETDSLVSGIEGIGRKVVVNQKLQLGDTDFRAPITEAIAKRVQLYIARSYPKEAVGVTKQMKELGGTDVLVQWNGGLTNAEVKALVNDETVMANVSQAGPLTSLDAFIAAKDERAIALNDALGKDVGSFSASVTDGLTILFRALGAAKSPTPKDLEAALSSLKASDIEGKTFATYRPQLDGDVFKDREVSIAGAVTAWQQGTGWVIQN